MSLTRSLYGKAPSAVFVLILACFWSVAANAQTFAFGTDTPLIWQKVKGTAQDVGVSPSGSVYVVSKSGRVWRWGSVLGEEWKIMSGHGFVRVDVGSSNKPWVVSEEGKIRYYNGLWWETRGKGFIDVGAGRKGIVYALTKGGDVAKWNAKEKRFDPVAGKRGLRIDVGKDGNPWIVGNDGTVFAYDGDNWNALPGAATDISIGPGGAVFATLSDGILARLNSTGNVWEPIKGVADITSVSVGPGDKPWVLSAKGRIFAASLFLPERQQQAVEETVRPASKPKARPRAVAINSATITDPSAIKFTLTSGLARDIAIGGDGSVFIVRQESTELGRYSNRRKEFIDYPGELTRLAVAFDGSPWGVNNKRQTYRHDGRDWVRVRGADAVDIAIGANGDVFVTDTDQVLFRLDASTGRFKRYPGVTGVRVAVDQNGKPWVVNALGEIRRCDVSPCQRLSRKGLDIAIGPDNSVFIADAAGKVLLYDTRAENWQQIRGVRFLANSIAVGPKGRPWAIDVKGRVHASNFFDRDESGDVLAASRTVKRTTTSTKSIFTFTKNMTFEEADVSALGGINILDIAAGADGTVFGIESSFDGEMPQSVFIFNEKSNAFESADDQPAVYASAIAVDADGEMWFTNTSPSTTTAYVYEQQGHSFKKRTGLEAGGGSDPDIAIGANGSVFAIDTYGKVYRYDPAAHRFKKFISTGTYSKIAVSPLGVPWVTNTSNVIYRYEETKFKTLSGVTETASDIGFGADGSLYISTPTTGALKRWNASNQEFDDLSNGTGGRLSVSPEGRPWFIASGDLTKVYKPKK